MHVSVVLDGRAGALGLVHRDIGGAQQIAWSSAVGGGGRDADADADGHREAFDQERLTERVVEPLHRFVDPTVDVDDQDGELVTTEPRRDRIGRQAVLQPVGERDQQRVAELVAQPVVDVLEPVEVHDEGGRPGGGACLVQRLGEALEERRAGC